MEEADDFAAYFLEDNIVTIHLEEGDIFKVQKGLLCNTAEYFKAALEGEYAEAESLTLTLPGCKAPEFKLFLYWMCNHSLPEYERVWELDWRTEWLETTFASLWILADFLGLPRLQNMAMQYLETDLEQREPDPDTIARVFDGTSEDSILRDYIVRKAAANWFGEDSCYPDDQKDELGAIPGFLTALSKVISPHLAGRLHLLTIDMDKVKKDYQVCENAEENKD